MFTVPVLSASQSDYSFLDYAKKIQNESMLIKIIKMSGKVRFSEFCAVISGNFWA